MNEKECIRRIEKSKTIPSLPTVIQKINSAVSDESCSVATLGSIIEKDQALASKILRLANSSYYGLARKVDTISRAVTLLGFSTVSNLALTISVLKIFQKGADNSAVLDIEGLWAHSLACGIASKRLLIKTDLHAAEKAFVAGILHDIGKLFILLELPDELNQIMTGIGKAYPDLLAAEHGVLEMTHADVGALMAEAWNFPADLIDAIRFHHHPHRMKFQSPIVNAVHVSNELVKAMELGRSNEPGVLPIYEKAWNVLSVDETQLSDIVKSVRSDYEAAEELISMD